MFFKWSRPLSIAALIAFSIAIAVHAEDEPKLKVGDPAPKLFVSKWLNGAPVEKFENGNVYVVECWATWCGPCRASIPHVSEMNTKFKDKNVVFIGMNVWEPDASSVEPFVKQMGAKMNYRVAIDEGGEQGKTAQAWLAASGQHGIPCAFVVDKAGKLAWIGHPMSNMEGVIEKILAGNFDPKKEAEIASKLKAIEEKLRAAAEKEDFDTMLKLADEILATDPSATADIAGMRFNIYLQGKKDYAKAYELGAKLLENELKDNPQKLNELAWTIADAKGVEKRDWDLAQKMAKRADELTKHSDPAILDTLARTYFDKGDKAKAIELQKLAIEKADSKEMKDELGKTLARYEAPSEK